MSFLSNLHFTSIIKIRGVNPYVLVSTQQAAALRPDWKKPIPVLVRVNGRSSKIWRTNIMPAGDGSFYLYLHSGIRKETMTKVGDSVTIDLSFDEDYHNGPLTQAPSWFRAGLEENSKAKTNWGLLGPSRKKEIIRYFSQLKSSEAKSRNLERVVNVLSGYRGRFMGRQWN